MSIVPETLPPPAATTVARRRLEVPRALAWLAILALVFLAGDRLLAAALGAALRHSQFRYSAALQPSTERRVLILGDSRSAAGMPAPEIARRIHAPVFNMSFNLMSPVVAEGLLRGYLDHNPPPRLLVLELDCMREDQGLLNGLMCYWDGYPALGKAAETWSPINRAATRLSHLYAFNGEVPLRALYFSRRSDQDMMLNRYRMNAAHLASIPTMAAIEMRARPENVEALRRIMTLAQQRGIPVRLLMLPYLPIAVIHWDRWVATIQAAVGPDVRLWDYRNAVSNVDQFADRFHLNDVGAVAFQDRLVRDGFFTVEGAANGDRSAVRAHAIR